jgi:DNA-binding beta-propeller fold protein YncE
LRKLLTYSALLCFLLFACVETPNNPTNYVHTDADTLSLKFPQSGAIVLCEGLWHYSNSDIYLYDKSSNTITEAYFKTATGKYLGDNASGILLTDKGNIVLVAGGSHELTYVNPAIPAIINTINIGYERATPREITQLGNRYYYTDLYRDEVRSGTVGDTLTLPDNAYQTGPAPEDIIAYGGKLYIANSGFGDYRQKEESAGTLQILDPTSGKSHYVYVGANLIQLAINRNEKYIACGYLNTPSAVQKGELGGIVFIDLETNQIIRQMEVKDFTDLALNEKTQAIYYLAKGGLYMLPSVHSRALPQLITPNSTTDIWYSLSFDPSTQQLWVGNARNYQSDGEVLMLSPTGNLLNRFEVGKNPRKVWFY